MDHNYSFQLIHTSYFIAPRYLESTPQRINGKLCDPAIIRHSRPKHPKFSREEKFQLLKTPPTTYLGHGHSSLLIILCSDQYTYMSCVHLCVCHDNKRLSHGWQCDMIFIKRVQWCDFYQTSGGAISFYHMPGLIETSSIPITPIYIIQAHTVTSCQTQQAMHNVLCDVLWQQKKLKKNYKYICFKY